MASRSRSVRPGNGHPILSGEVSGTLREQLFTTSVTVEEQLKGRLAYINIHRNSVRKVAQGHAALVRAITYFSRWNILLYTEDADSIVRQLRKQPMRIGSQDPRIAAISPLHGFTVVTGDVGDFTPIPNLKVEDWTTASQ